MGPTKQSSWIATARCCGPRDDRNTEFAVHRVSDTVNATCVRDASAVVAVEPGNR